MCKNTTPSGFRCRESRFWRGRQNSRAKWIVNAGNAIFVRNFQFDAQDWSGSGNFAHKIAFALLDEAPTLRA
jgi:hypothetical protein